MFPKLFRALLVLFLALSFSAKGYSTSIVLDVNDIAEDKYKYRVIFPFGFYTDDFGLAGGLGGGTSGYFQKQLGLYGAFMVSTNGSFGFYFLEEDFQPPFGNRLFINAEGYITRYAKYKEYIGKERVLIKNGAGTNDSDKDDYLQGKGWDNQIEPTFTYVLPIGVGKEKPVNTYILDNGLLIEGATCTGTWNPFKSGRTYLNLTPFVHWQGFSHSKHPMAAFNSNGAALEIKYDNTDFYTNPSRGSSQRFQIRRDFGMFDSNNPWTSLELECSKYFSLGETSWFRQQVIALNFLTAYSPTMEYQEQDGLLVAKNAPPDYYGANLGGLFHLRGFDDRRFHDKASIYYSIEYRMIPRWQPLPEINLLRPFEIDWWEFVLFAEAGRVAPEWDFSTLNSRLKIDGGISARVMSFRSIGRLDFAFSEEGFFIRAFIGHPF